MNKPRSLLIAMLSLAGPQIAQAHLVSTGLGPLYDGVTHFALTPEDGLPVAALALFAGLRGPAYARMLLGVLPLAWFAGGLIGVFAVPIQPSVLLIATALILLLIGGALAANLELPLRAGAMLCAALGLTRGAADLSDVALSVSSIATLCGMSLGVFVVFALAASVSLPLRRFWSIIATRIAGSWLAALGLLLAGWIIRYGDKLQ